jgi:amino acid transporter
VLLALVACLLVATSIGQLAKHLPSAGSIFTYPAEAIHPALGFLVGWGYALVEALLGPITMVLSGYLLSSVLHSDMVFNLSCIFFYLRRQRSEFNVLLHAVIPVLGILAFIPAWLTALGIGSSFLKFVTPLSYPSSLTGPVIGVWLVIGLIVLAYLYARHPERLPEMKRVFADDSLPASDEPVTSGGAA